MWILSPRTLSPLYTYQISSKFLNTPIHRIVNSLTLTLSELILSSLDINFSEVSSRFFARSANSCMTILSHSVSESSSLDFRSQLVRTSLLDILMLSSKNSKLSMRYFSANPCTVTLISAIIRETRTRCAFMSSLGW